MSCKQYLSLKGRLNRMRYFPLFLLIGIILDMINPTTQHLGNIYLFDISVIVTIVSIIIGLYITILRLHDLERPGTHVLLLLIPLYNLYLLLVLLFDKGTDGPNKYGKDPTNL